MFRSCILVFPEGMADTDDENNTESIKCTYKCGKST